MDNSFLNKGPFMQKVSLIYFILFLSCVLIPLACDKYTLKEDSLFFKPALKPFYHGVASGDPMFDRVIIWTKVTPGYNKDVLVKWEVATDETFNNVINLGTLKAKKENDFTVQVDVPGLQAYTKYYYRFEALGKKSIVGKTRTAPKSTVDSLKFVLVTGCNFEAGYFNAYARIAERNDLTAVIHTGDYIYEYPHKKYGSTTLDTTFGRFVIPDNELLDLEDYRLRYARYRLDKDLRKAHQNHPFIIVWDDHEIANDCYVDGAQNHQPELEGDWNARKAAAKKAFYEWFPIRGKKVYRKFNFGNLTDLIMLDERLEGRTKQLAMSDPNLADSSRTILGKKQYHWFTEQLLNSGARWKLIGNQVILSRWNIKRSHQKMYKFKDKWPGYPFERNKILGFIKYNKIDNIVILSGDFHSSMAFDVTDAPLNKNKYEEPQALAVEVVTPSVTSANYDFYLPLDSVKAIENMYINDPKNTHLKYVDLVNHGYLLVTVKKDEVKSDWYFVDRIDTVSQKEYLAKSLYVRNKENRLNKK
jgi:alkaline phosphatase D